MLFLCIVHSGFSLVPHLMICIPGTVSRSLIAQLVSCPAHSCAVLWSLKSLFPLFSGIQLLHLMTPVSHVANSSSLPTCGRNTLLFPPTRTVPALLAIFAVACNPTMIMTICSRGTSPDHHLLILSGLTVCTVYIINVFVLISISRSFNAGYLNNTGDVAFN